MHGRLMKIYLVRHGEAVSPEIDPQKPLSPQGEEEIQNIAKLLAKKSFPVSSILHSKKLRSKQTAEIIGHYLAPDLKCEEYAHLNPDDSIEFIVQRIESANEDLMVVGHLPFLDKLTSYLVTGDENIVTVNFQTGTTVCLESVNNKWVIDWEVGLDQI